MRVHGSCVARAGAEGPDGVLILGPAGSGKSDLSLRLIDRGFALVADDQVLLDGAQAGPAPQLAGLIEVRGMGLLQVAHVAPVQVALVVELRPASSVSRLPAPARHPPTGAPLLALDPSHASAAQRVEWALDCVLGRRMLRVGAFAA